MIDKQLALDIYFQYYGGKPYTSIKGTIINIINSVPFNNCVMIGNIKGNTSDDIITIFSDNKQNDGSILTQELRIEKSTFIDIPVVSESIDVQNTTPDTSMITFIGYVFYFN